MSGGTLYSRRILDALALMYELHHAQTRKGSGVPYITHLLGVAAIAGEFGADEDTFIAALLHDAVEDQGGRETLARIESAFGETVADLVLGASDATTHPKPPWRERKERHIEHMRAAGPRLRLLLCADKIHNLRTLNTNLRQFGAEYWRHFNGGREGTIWYYAAACEALSHGWEHEILEALRCEVALLQCVVSESGR